MSTNLESVSGGGVFMTNSVDRMTYNIRERNPLFRNYLTKNYLNLGQYQRKSKMSTQYLTYHSQVIEEVSKIPMEYLPSFLKIARAFRESVGLPSAEESFRRGWQEAQNGEVHPISELWVGIDAE